MAGPSSASVPPALERGKACLRCRRRKMRCDGMRPACSQCVRSHAEDCEYTDGGPTTTQILERSVADLEARIRELEGGDAAVLLFDPHAAATSGTTASGHPNTNVIPTSQRIIQSFLDHSNSFGFFLHPTRFLNNLTSSIPPSDQSPIPAALVHAVYLLGVAFSGDPSLSQQEPQILNRTLHHLTSSLDPSRIVYILQAEILLSYYLFYKGRKLEGGYHASAAVSIAVACKLHKIRSVSWAGTATAGEVTLPQPADAVEEGERILAFWNVLFLDRCWSVWSQSPSLLIQEASSNMQIDTPWPLKMSSYEQHLMPPGNAGAHTVQKFLRGLTTETPYQSFLALRAKASILYERSSHVAAHWNSASAESHAQLQTLDTRTQQFIQSLPRLAEVDPARVERSREILVIYTLSHCATLQLYAPAEQPAMTEASRSLAAANSAADILRVIEVSRLQFVDPILGVLWGIIGQTLVNGLVSLHRSTAYTASRSYAVSSAEIIMTSSLNRVIEAMDVLKNASPLIAEELNKLRSSIRDNQAGVL